MAGKGYRKIRKSLRLIHVCPCLLNLAYKQSLPFLHLQLKANLVRQGKLDDMGGYITNEPEDNAKTIEVAIEASSDDSQRQVRTIRPPTRTATTHPPRMELQAPPDQWTVAGVRVHSSLNSETLMALCKCGQENQNNTSL